MAPLVSIIAPSYNHSRFVGACLESVLAQTFSDWELIVVDDGSSDDSVAIAETFSLRDPRIQVHRNPKNLGTYGTEQRALDMAKGQLIAVLNTDDIWLPTKLAAQVSHLTSHQNASFSATLGDQIDAQGEIEPDKNVHSDWPVDTVQDFLPWLLQENRILASSVLFRREGLRFETTCRYSGDWVALIEASLRGPCAFIPEPLTQWRVHGSNAHFMSEPRLLEEIRVRKSLLRQAWPWPSTQTQEGRKRMDLAILDLVALYLTAGAKAEAITLLPRILSSAKRAATLKRLAGAAMPRKLMLQRLWPSGWESFLAYSPADLKRKMKSVPPIIFQQPKGT